MKASVADMLAAAATLAVGAPVRGEDVPQ